MELDGAAFDVGGDEADPDGVAGGDVVGRDVGEDGRVDELDQRASVVLVDDDGVEHLLLAPGEQDCFGQLR